MKCNILFIYLTLGILIGCNSRQGLREHPAKKDKKVSIELTLFGAWDWNYTDYTCMVNELYVYISGDSVSYKLDRDESIPASEIVVDDYTANRIKGLADSLFVKNLLPIYDMKRKVESTLEYEGDILDIECSSKKISIYLGDVYFKGIQQEGSYEFVYSRPFRLFVQLLYDVCATNCNKGSQIAYERMLREMDKKDRNEVLIPHIVDIEEEQTLSEETVRSVVEDMPSFPCGYDSLLNYLATSIRYPAIEKEKGIEERVFCQFVVECDGSITDIKVVRGVNSSLDKEAVRVIKSMPKWNPGKENGEAVRVRYTLPVTFSSD